MANDKYVGQVVYVRHGSALMPVYDREHRIIGYVHDRKEICLRLADAKCSLADADGPPEFREGQTLRVKRLEGNDVLFEEVYSGKE